MSKVRTRFAPSPTGMLHIGGIRTALYNYLFAKKHGGEFVLRLEDTDRERFVADGVEQIVAGLDWVGLRPDIGFWISEGKHQNVEYIQSERNKQGTYKKWAEELIDKGLAYYSPTTSAQLDALRQKAKDAKKPFIYRRADDTANDTVIIEHAPIRLDIEAIKTTLSSKVEWQDEIRGQFADSLDIIEDFILIKSDGFPTYNFANVIDDHDMAISHVIRGDEFISSTSKHSLLYDLFGWRTPQFVHLPVINGADGKKLSKRTGDTNVLDYRAKGYLPEALLNFLALLGWNDGSEQEIFSMDELQSKFDLVGLNSSPAIFDQKRLDWMNGSYIRSLKTENLYELAHAFWPDAAKSKDKDYKTQVLRLVQERLKYLAELPELTKFFFEEPKDTNVKSLLSEPSDKQLKKLDKSVYKSLLSDAYSELQELEFTEKKLQACLDSLLIKLDSKPGILFALIRIAITGSPASPPIAATMSVLGKEITLARFNKTLRLL